MIAEVAISGFFLSAIPHREWVVWGVIGLMVLTTGLLGFALWPVKWKDAPEPRLFATLANRTPEQMRQEALPTVLGAFADNEPPLLRKSRWSNIAAASAALSLAALVIGRAVWG